MERKRLPRRSVFERAALAATAFVASVSVLSGVLLLFATAPDGADAKLASAAAASAARAAAVRVARRS